MKTLFFIAALAAAVFLVMQTPAGQAWIQEIEPEQDVSIQTNIEDTQSVENKISALVQQFNQQQQTQIDQLENRIAELENELIMGRVAKKTQPSIESVESPVVTLHPYKQPDAQVITQPTKQSFEISQEPETLVATSTRQLQRNRQARLQDIAEKMEMSSLQALVN